LHLITLIEAVNVQRQLSRKRQFPMKQMKIIILKNTVMKNTILILKNVA